MHKLKNLIKMLSRIFVAFLFYLNVLHDTGIYTGWRLALEDP